MIKNKIILSTWSNIGFEKRINKKGCIGIRIPKSKLSLFRDIQLLEIDFFGVKLKTNISRSFFERPIICDKKIKSFFIEKNLICWEYKDNPKLESYLEDNLLKIIKIL